MSRYNKRGSYADSEPYEDGERWAGVPKPQAAKPAASPAAGLIGVSWAEYSTKLDEMLADGGAIQSGFNLRAPASTIEDIARLAGFDGPALISQGYTGTGIGEGGEFSFRSEGQAINPELARQLESYRVSYGADLHSPSLIDPSGRRVGEFRHGDRPTGFDKVFEAIVISAVVAMTAGAVVVGLAPAAAGVAGGVGAGAGAAEAAFVFHAAADSQIASTALGITGAQAAAAAVVPAAVNLGTLGGIVSTAAPSAFEVLVQSFVEVLQPAAAVETAPAFVFHAAVDSQIASTALGITGAQAAAAAVVPVAVDLGTLGGIVSTAAPSAVADLLVKTGTKLATNAAKAEIIKALKGGAADGAPAISPFPGRPQASTSTAGPDAVPILLALALAAMAVF